MYRDAKIEYNDFYGYHVVAEQVIPKNTLIVAEEALVLVPTSSQVCISCHKLPKELSGHANWETDMLSCHHGKSSEETTTEENKDNNKGEYQATVTLCNECIDKGVILDEGNSPLLEWNLFS
jgi:hypothetical protein